MRMTIAVCILILICANQVQGQTLLVNAQVEETSLSHQDVKSIFLGTTSHWKNGLPISLCIDTSNKELFKSFIKNAMGKNVRSFKRLWSKRVFSGESAALPLLINDSERALKYLSEKQGAVCYIGSVPEHLPKQLKPLNSPVDESKLGPSF